MKKARAAGLIGFPALSLFVASCGGSDGEQGSEAVIDPGDRGRYEPSIDPADFVDGIDNPYLPLTVGWRWLYEGTEDGKITSTEGSWQAGVDGAQPDIVMPAKRAVRAESS